jgi:hypothetical protein
VPSEQLFVDSNNALNFHKRASAAGLRAKGGSAMIVCAKSKVAPPPIRDPGEAGGMDAPEMDYFHA